MEMKQCARISIGAIVFVLIAMLWVMGIGAVLFVTIMTLCALGIRLVFAPDLVKGLRNEWFGRKR